MTTMTFNALNANGSPEGIVMARMLDFAGRAFIAAVPFAAIAWMFLAH
jgi:hypothetical protein